METELQKLRLLRSFNLKSDSFKLRQTDSSIHREHDPDIEFQGYTSLKDVIHSPPTNAASLDPVAFDSSTISIRNVLVKHAASVYVQSAILTNRDRNCLSHFLEKIKSQVSCRSCWQIYVREPLSACFRVIFRYLHYMVNGAARVWRGRVAIR